MGDEEIQEAEEVSAESMSMAEADTIAPARAVYSLAISFMQVLDDKSPMN